MNYKNRVQEFCQKRKYPLPTYESTQTLVDRTNNDFSFNAVLTLVDDNGRELITQGIGKRKIDAEQHAASQMCNILHQYTKKERLDGNNMNNSVPLSFASNKWHSDDLW